MPFNGGEEPWPAGSPPRSPQEPSAFRDQPSTSGSAGPIRGIQVDGGAEFKSVFEAECQARGLELFVLPPKWPDLNGGVERAQSTWRYEFYGTYDLPHQIDELQAFVDAFAHRFIDDRKFGIFRRSPRHRHSRTSLQKARWRFGLVRNAKQWQDADEIGGYLGNSGSGHRAAYGLWDEGNG
jgi:hypothetical protein